MPFIKLIPIEGRLLPEVVFADRRRLKWRNTLIFLALLLCWRAYAYVSWEVKEAWTPNKILGFSQSIAKVDFDLDPRACKSELFTSGQAALVYGFVCVDNEPVFVREEDFRPQQRLWVGMGLPTFKEPETPILGTLWNLMDIERDPYPYLKDVIDVYGTMNMPPRFYTSEDVKYGLPTIEETLIRNKRLES